MERYWKKFTGYVYETLGGLDMAEEFFQRHPRLRRSMRVSCRYHFGKGGPYSAKSASTIFFERALQPVITADRERARKRPIRRRKRD